MEQQFFLSDITYHFNLRNPKGDKPTPIYMVIRYKGVQYKLPLGVKVIPHHFSKGKALISCALSNLDNHNNKIVNDTLFEYQEKFLSLQNVISNDIDNDFKVILYKVYGMTKKTEKKLAIAELTSILLEQTMKESSKDAYMKEIKTFREYLKTLKKDIYLNDIDIPFMRGYIAYLRTLTDTHKITKETVPIEDNTVAAKYKKLLTIFGYLDKADLFDASKITKLKKTFGKEDKTFENHIFLDADEIAKLCTIELKGDYDIVRDIFLFQMELGQRIGDIILLMGHDLTSSIHNGKITIIQEKTNAKVNPPLSDIALNILEKYNYVLPNITLTKINKLIKEICKKCNINEICDCVEMRGGKPYKYHCEKWEIVSSHTCRRSFISNAIKDGIATHLIKSISGHSSDAFDRYNRVSNEDLADKFAETKRSNAKVIEYTPNDRNAQNGAFPEEIEVLRKVLTMLGVPPYIWIEEKTIGNLWRIVINQENRIIEKIGCDYQYLKDLFNNDEISLIDKITIINNELSK